MTNEIEGWVATAYDDGIVRHETVVGDKAIIEKVMLELKDALDRDLRMGVKSIRVDFQEVKR